MSETRNVFSILTFFFFIIGIAYMIKTFIDYNPLYFEYLDSSSVFGLIVAFFMFVAIFVWLIKPRLPRL